MQDPEVCKRNFAEFDVLPLPLDPEVKVRGIIPDKATLFKVSMGTIHVILKLTFGLKHSHTAKMKRYIKGQKGNLQMSCLLVNNGGNNLTVFIQMSCIGVMDCIGVVSCIGCIGCIYCIVILVIYGLHTECHDAIPSDIPH